MNLNRENTIDHAVEAYERGYTPIPIRPGTKRPFDPSWTALHYDSVEQVRTAFAAEPCSLGVALGRQSGGLVDVDLDHPKAMTAAQIFLRGTTVATSGRAARPGSHYWYIVRDGLPDGTTRWQHSDPKYPKRTLVELRSTGGQTLIAPSVHPDGDAYVWGEEPWGGPEGPSVIDGRELRSRVGCIGLATLLAIEWPTRGGRHDAYLALAGALLAEGYGDTRRISPVWKELAPGIIGAIATATHDEEGMQTRIQQSVESTIQKIARGKPTQGWPTLMQHLPEAVVERCKDFVFGVEEAEGHTRPVAAQDVPYDPYADAAPSPAYSGPGATAGAYEDEEDAEEDQAATDEAHRVAFERMVQHEVLRMEVREVARDRYAEVKAEKQMADNPELIAPIRTAADVLTDDPPEPGRIERLLPWNSSMLLVAQRKTGKTIWLCNLAHALLTGEKFLNEFEVRALEPNQTVAIMNFEVNGPMLADDLRRRGVPMERVIQIDLRGRLNPFKHKSVRASMTKALKENNVATIFVDTFAQAFTGESQNDTADVGNWLRELNEWVRAEVGAIDLVLTAHAGWDGDRARGSSALEDWADSIVHLRRTDKDDMNSMRQMRANGREDVRVEWGNLPFDQEERRTWFEEADDVDKVQAQLDRLAAADEAIRDALRIAPEPLRAQELCDTAGALPAGRGISNRALDQARQRLVVLGEVTTSRGTGRGSPLLHALNPDYEPEPEAEPGNSGE